MRHVRASELRGRAWLGTGGRDLTLADLRGKLVLLDFWTFCCINCLHVLDELRPLEAKYADDLVIIGVHSPKFAHEADPTALRDAIARYDIRHPVLDDPDLTTWTAYGARAWPTLVLIDPEGYVVTRMAGEGHGSALDGIVGRTVGEARAKGTLRSGSGPYVPPPPASGSLAFPSKAIPLNGDPTNLLVADAGHHQLVQIAPDGEVVRRIGSGLRGLADGPADEARFSEPSGLTQLPAELAAKLGYDVVVADTVNHALRGVRLADGLVTTLAGTGQQWMQGDGASWFVPGAPPVAPPREVPLSSPWDVVWHEELQAVAIAMAGIHQLWAFNPLTGALGPIAGTRSEGLLDGPAGSAWLAQPSGLAMDGPRMWFVDSETSSLRVFEPDQEAGTGWRVTTAVGQGLFDFGLADGPGAQALMQHPLGLTVEPASRTILVADTYNGALRRYDPSTSELSTLATNLSEPSDVIAADAGHVLVVESAAHRVVELSIDAAVRVADRRQATNRPVTELSEGLVHLTVPFSPAPGQKLDTRFGPAVELTVSATPPQLLEAGAGTTAELTRELVFRPGEGVLHVTARAASCDVEAENPACHMVGQDWGVPVRIVARDGIGRDDQTGRIELPLRG
ncbi:MAG: NHL domain-containing thioredoxin family protein [Bifidobacteriaceae bacterium]|jgi:thiol-disulfide isomerase/thioredoxin|nr:NHL domain-containing thioredoxin family protein [Bifidobacteriaceae bacterium]